MVPFAAYQELVRELASMKREGFVPTAPVGEPATPAQLPTVIEAAILALGVDQATERHLRKMAWEFKRTDMDDAEIAEKITNGEDVPL